MTAAPFATVAGERVTEVRVYVPPTGPWWAEVTFEADPEVSGRVTIQLGELALVGTVDPARNGTFGIQRRCRIVAGAGGWTTLLPAKGYHNDAGVRARLIAEDAARLAGETLGAFAPGSEKVGSYYTRKAGAASRALEDVAGGASWWVAYDGTTHVGERGTSTPAEDAYEVLEVEPDDRTVTLAVDDLEAVGIGAVLSKNLDASLTVRELELVVREDGVRVKAWCGGEEGSRGRLEGLLRAIVGRVLSERVWGCHRFRVVRLSGDRLELQPVKKTAGLPDVLPVSMWPGVAGAHAELALGAEVLVEFIEGDPTQPIVRGFAGKDGTGFVPTSLVLDASTEIKLGASAAAFVALASLVDVELTKITTTLGTGSNSGGSVTWGTPYVKASVAASKVKAL